MSEHAEGAHASVRDAEATVDVVRAGLAAPASDRDRREAMAALDTLAADLARARDPDKTAAYWNERVEDYVAQLEELDAQRYAAEADLARVRSGPQLIPIYKKGEILTYAIVDGDDYERLAAQRWFLTGSYPQYSTTTAGRKSITTYMHRLIMGLDYGDAREVDHINHCKLDNRKTNLRIVTHAENMLNRPPYGHGVSPHRGVYFDKSNGRWRAQIRVNGKTVSRYYPSELEAAREAERMRDEHRGIEGGQ